MGITRELREQVLELKDTEKARLVELLLESLDRPDPEITEKWVQESEARYEVYKSGKAKTVNYEDVKRRVEGGS